MASLSVPIKPLRPAEAMAAATRWGVSRNSDHSSDEKSDLESGISFIPDDTRLGTQNSSLLTSPNDRTYAVLTLFTCYRAEYRVDSLVSRRLVGRCVEYLSS